jgi:hypothetical protein
VNVLTRAQIQAHSVPGNKTIVIWSESSAEIEACSVPGNKMVVLGQRMPMERLEIESLQREQYFVSIQSSEAI